MNDGWPVASSTDNDLGLLGANPNSASTAALRCPRLPCSQMILLLLNAYAQHVFAELSSITQEQGRSQGTVPGTTPFAQTGALGWPGPCPARVERAQK